MVRDFAGGGAVGEGVVGDTAGDDGAFGEVADILPAEGALPSPFGVRAAKSSGKRVLPGPGIGAECFDGGHGFRGIGALVRSGDDVAGQFIRGNRVSGITSRVPTGMRTGSDGGVSRHGSASGVIRGGRGRQRAGADFGPQVGVVAGQAAEA